MATFSFLWKATRWWNPRFRDYWIKIPQWSTWIDILTSKTINIWIFLISGLCMYDKMFYKHVPTCGFLHLCIISLTSIDVVTFRNIAVTRILTCFTIVWVLASQRTVQSKESEQTLWIYKLLSYLILVNQSETI